MIFDLWNHGAAAVISANPVLTRSGRWRVRLFQPSGRRVTKVYRTRDLAREAFSRSARVVASHMRLGLGLRWYSPCLDVAFHICPDTTEAGIKFVRDLEAAP